MVGASSQIGLVGTQDLYLTGNPQITYFKAVYRRHTNFAIEAIQQSYNGSVGNSQENQITCILSKSGDLVKDVWVEVTLPASAVNGANTGATYINWVNNTGHAFLKRSQCYIGSDLIDEHDSRWLDIWNELTDHEEKEHLGLNKHNAGNTYLKSNTGTLPTCTLNIPLKFWFNRNPGLALPIVALNFSDVKLVLTTRDLRALVNTDATAGNQNQGTFITSNINIFVDYIFLDTAERRRFASNAHEYLIEQVQFDTPQALLGAVTQNIKVNFSHPVKELIWVFFTTQRQTELTGAFNNDRDATKNTSYLPGTAGATVANGSQRHDYFNYSCGGVNATDTVTAVSSGSDIYTNSTAAEHFDTLEIKFDNSTRFAPRKAVYFRTCQPQQAGHRVPKKHIYLYSFALNAEDYQPSGTVNCSKIDQIDLKFNNVSQSGGANVANNVNRSIAVYAVNYNILRIMSGMGGLAYTN